MFPVLNSSFHNGFLSSFLLSDTCFISCVPLLLKPSPTSFQNQVPSSPLTSCLKAICFENLYSSSLSTSIITIMSCTTTELYCFFLSASGQGPWVFQCFVKNHVYLWLSVNNHYNDNSNHFVLLCCTAIHLFLCVWYFQDMSGSITKLLQFLIFNLLYMWEICSFFYIDVWMRVSVPTCMPIHILWWIAIERRLHVQPWWMNDWAQRTSRHRSCFILDVAHSGKGSEIKVWDTCSSYCTEAYEATSTSYSQMKQLPGTNKWRYARMNKLLECIHERNAQINISPLISYKNNMLQCEKYQTAIKLEQTKRIKHIELSF